MDGYLIEPRNTIAILKKYNIHFQKKYGQNFLIDSHVMNKIINAADINENDCVLEIGPGIGTMTQFLCEKAARVVAVEIDRALVPVLKDTLSRYDNVQIIQGDILKQDISELSKTYNEGRPFKMAANLPYYITTPIIMGILENDMPVDSITVMVQKEVAMRMQAEPGTKDYGALSLAVQYYASPYLAANVPQNCFMPRPNVASAVITLKKRNTPPVQVRDRKLMFGIIRASFQQRRKTLVNSLRNNGSIDVNKDVILSALDAMGLTPTVRGEMLTLEQFARLSDLLCD